MITERPSEEDELYLKELLDTLERAKPRLVQMGFSALDEDVHLLSCGVEKAITGLRGLADKLNLR